MNLINPDGSIRALHFICMVKNEDYRVLETKSTHTGDFWKDSVWKAVDVVKRISDGAVKAYTREEMKERFKQIKLI